MSTWGKLAGASAGYFIGGIIGAVVGAVAGHYVCLLYTSPSPRDNR